ncbi:inner membrane protein [Sphingomonas sp. F9_3S_D5_B_2]
MDNITHTLVGGLLGQMGLKRRSRFAMAACLLGANAPDIDVFAPLVLPVQGISFHRGPVHSVFAWPILAAAIVGILWLVDRLVGPRPGSLPLRPVPLFVAALLAVLTHPFLDWLTTYAIAIFSPASWRWYSADAIFIVDWVYWVLMVAGIGWSAVRWRRGSARAGRPAQIAGALMLAYIAFNVAESSWAERTIADRLRQRGVEPTLVVASPPPFAFWRRSMAWRSANQWGDGELDWDKGLTLAPDAEPLRLDDPRLASAVEQDAHVRAFLVWSRMPLVVVLGGKAYLTDQRFYSAMRSATIPAPVRKVFRRNAFLIPLDTPAPAE